MPLQVRALEHDRADDPQEMRQRENLTQRLRPFGMPRNGKHEARQQKRRQEEEEGELHRLHLGAAPGSKMRSPAAPAPARKSGC
jgi:hypothetical protein